MITLILKIIGILAIAIASKMFYDSQKQKAAGKRYQHAVHEFIAASIPLTLEFRPLSDRSKPEQRAGHLFARSDKDGYAVLLGFNSGGSLSKMSDIIRVKSNEPQIFTDKLKPHDYIIMDKNTRMTLMGGGGIFFAIMTSSEETLDHLIGSGSYVGRADIQTAHVAQYPAE